MSFFWRGDRKAAAAASKVTVPEAVTDTVAASKIFPRLLTSLAQIEGPVVMDLGPVVGANVAFLGDELGCTLLVQDSFVEVETCAQRGDREGTGAALVSRFSRPPASVDAILCWDLFDYLDRSSARLVAQALVAQLKPGASLHAFFGQSAGVLSHYTRFAIEGRSAWRLKTVPATSIPREVYVVREIDRMFEGLAVVESVLLKSRSRETLFRKLV